MHFIMTKVGSGFMYPSKSVLVNIQSGGYSELKIDFQELAPLLRFQAQVFSAQDISDWSERVCSDLRSFRPRASRNCSCSRDFVHICGRNICFSQKYQVLVSKFIFWRNLARFKEDCQQNGRETGKSFSRSCSRLFARAAFSAAKLACLFR